MNTSGTKAKNLVLRIHPLFTGGQQIFSKLIYVTLELEGAHTPEPWLKKLMLDKVSECLFWKK